MIRAKAPEGDETAQRAAVEQIKGALDTKRRRGLVYRRAEFVGPRVSEELLHEQRLGGPDLAAGRAALSVVPVRVAVRHRRHRRADPRRLGHDRLYAISGLEFNLTSVAAVLTIVGYSLNDTVVIYDRVRENLRRYKAMPLEQLLDRSINETLARTLMTSLTTLVALLPLWIFGGEVIRGFTIIMIWGVVIGTYSTIYIATPVLYYLNLRTTAEKAQAAAQQPAR